MNDQIRYQAALVRDLRRFVESERQIMRDGKLNPRIFESYEMNLSEAEKELCTRVLAALESEGKNEHPHRGIL